jgi:dipeptidyl aminopeptidase/acylaminoacyl peptidase
MSDIVRTVSFSIAIAVVLSDIAAAQSPTKTPLDHSVYDEWKRIESRTLSDDGRWISYTLDPQDGDADLRVINLTSDVAYSIPRGVSAEFDDDAASIVFFIQPEDSLVKAAKREEKAPDEEPQDSLGILNLESGEVARVARVKSFKMPEEAGGWLAYRHLAPPKSDSGETRERNASDRDDEEDEEEEGTELVVRNVATGAERRIEHVTEYAFANDGRRLAYTTFTKNGIGNGAFVLDLSDGNSHAILQGQGSYKGIVFADDGDQVAFLSNRDDHDADQPAFTLYHWQTEASEARALASEGSDGVPAGWWVSEHGELLFSDSGKRVFFGTAPRPDPEPEDVPEYEQVELDVWNWRDSYLQPMQLVQRDEELKRTFKAVVHLADGRVVQLASDDVPTVTLSTDGDADLVLGTSRMPYRQLISWDSPAYDDVYIINAVTGERRLVLEKLQGGQAQLSPGARYISWWDRNELAWYAMGVGGGAPVNLTANVPHPVHNELHDWPYKPNAYGSAGWTENDGAFLIYDRHDIWAADPTGGVPRNITEGVGRRDELRFRYARVDEDEEFIPENETILLATFDYRTKDAGFYQDRVRGDREPRRILMMDRRFGTPVKAEDAEIITLTRESFQEFPDLWVSNVRVENLRQVSEANPQQSQYLWGTAELVHWRSVDGQPLQGLLYKPEQFDASTKYPMMVYFYEKNSQNLHAHRAPFPGRSSINISFYVSRGYVVFVPDIHYRVGYPGESALNSVVSGVLSVVEKGFVDERRIGVQGHSWGGYQTAYLVTRTNIFSAAEAGAPVSNMTSAYGGIRWGTGLSRMMQYEKTQSRLGGSLWEARQRYIENSPLFWADKIETPLLMLHNDEDTAVPWYQGIEFFVALRRLAKPVWLLNYNGEPHGLRKYQNRKDWAVRMQQFFDHYLKDAPPAVWMIEGVPAVAKGRTSGLELVTELTTKEGGNR